MPNFNSGKCILDYAKNILNQSPLERASAKELLKADLLILGYKETEIDFLKKFLVFFFFLC